MDQETWRFINTFAPWLSALGTICAVVMSLYLARKGNRIELDVHAGIRIEGRIRGSGQVALFRVGVEIDGHETAPHLVWVSITNIGRRSATITHLFLRPACFWKRGILLTPSPSGSLYSTDFPTTLDDGKSADYGWLVSEFLPTQVAEKFRTEFKGFRGAIKLRLLRVCVGTSTGDVFRCNPEKELCELLRKMATTPVP